MNVGRCFVSGRIHTGGRGAPSGTLRWTACRATAAACHSADDIRITLCSLLSTLYSLLLYYPLSFLLFSHRLYSTATVAIVTLLH